MLSKFCIPCSANKDYFDADPDPQFKNNELSLDEEKKLVGISEEFLADRIKRFKGYKSVLDRRQDEYGRGRRRRADCLRSHRRQLRYPEAMAAP